VIAAPVAFIAFDQRLSGLQMAGALVVVLTSIWMVVLERPTARPAST
jgi:drug/metabolite transporter (DMT)-like permease